jgi:molybdopterin molybdotransferase
LQDGELGVRSTGHQGSGILRSMSEADGLVVLEGARGRVEAGELVSFLAFEGLV